MIHTSNENYDKYIKQSELYFKNFEVFKGFFLKIMSFAEFENL